MIKIFWIDLFSGAGGTTTGIHLADKSNNVKVVACVNHDEIAIKSHMANHPNCLHFIEDVRDYKVVYKLKLLVEELRRNNPGCVINLWASLECTNYSKAKGGLPRDGDSRTLAYSLYNYIDELEPDYVYVENVREFMSWGPLNDKGRPVSRLNGTEYQSWLRTIEKMGYEYDKRMLNSADFSAFQSRNRYFGQFVRRVNFSDYTIKDRFEEKYKKTILLPISWPTPTHTKDPVKNQMFPGLKKWKAVKDVLDLNDEGVSIFLRETPLVENTLKRIYAGLIKFIAGGEKQFLNHIHGGVPSSKVWSVNGPNRTVAGSGHHSIVNTEFLAAYYSTGENISSLDSPCPVVSTKDRFNKVKPIFITNYYSGGGELSDIDNPSPTLTGIPKQRITSVKFIDQQFGNSKPSSVDNPIGCLTANPKYNIINVRPWLMDTNFNNIGSSIESPSNVITASRHHHYIINPSWGGNGHSTEKPSPVVIARQDKAPLYVICAEFGSFGIIVYESDSEMTIKIKEFMAAYGISDIKMRMLKIIELLRIQGFPENYLLEGNQTEQKKHIGNAVEVNMAKHITKSNMDGIIEFMTKIKKAS